MPILRQALFVVCHSNPNPQFQTAFNLTKSLSRRLKFIFWLTQVFVLLSCSDKGTPNSQVSQHYSSTQTYLLKLIEEYKADYFLVNKPSDREAIQVKYQNKMEHLLVDSLGRYIDSMTVIVDTVVHDGWLVTTQFHTGDIEFKYGMKFQVSMPPSADSLYQFMTNLSPGKQVTVDFIHLGGGELNYPDDKSKRTMRIFAYPQPIKASK